MLNAVCNDAVMKKKISLSYDSNLSGNIYLKLSRFKIGQMQDKQQNMTY